MIALLERKNLLKEGKKKPRFPPNNSQLSSSPPTPLVTLSSSKVRALFCVDSTTDSSSLSLLRLLLRSRPHSTPRTRPRTNSHSRSQLLPAGRQPGLLCDDRVWLIPAHILLRTACCAGAAKRLRPARCLSRP